ncbi:hypothetical protein KUCAC02_006881, partial [Chaenocephalus aceratus]
PHDAAEGQGPDKASLTQGLHGPTRAPQAVKKPFSRSLSQVNSCRPCSPPRGTQPGSVTLEREDACVWWTPLGLNFLSDPLPDVFLRAAEGGLPASRSRCEDWL